MEKNEKRQVKDENEVGGTRLQCTWMDVLLIEMSNQLPPFSIVHLAYVVHFVVQRTVDKSE
uniref:Uncharacterized protein n=1 Tax=Pristionchus pacificus TaxID=54126 RepID=A0A2A6B466_PRIPA|eukprot:PDM60670.1 hypothetical protein PRIPAC_53939 [Pristionchus pacificus]